MANEGRSPNSAELEGLFDLTFRWVADHGQLVPALNQIGEAADGLVIVDGLGPAFKAGLPVDKLRQHDNGRARRALATLGVSSSLEISAYPPFHVAMGDGTTELQRSFLQVEHDTGPKSPYSLRGYAVFKDQTERNKPLYTSDGQVETREGRVVPRPLNLYKFNALRTIVRVWTTHWLEMAGPGEDRRLDW